MAEEHVGQRPAAWTRIFSAFRVALDLKKLVLAGAGVLATALGWLVLSWLLYNAPGVGRPEWKEQGNNDEEKDASWVAFKSARASWNLLHELAGPADPSRAEVVEAADVARSRAEYDKLRLMEHAFKAHQRKIVLATGKDGMVLRANEKVYPITLLVADKDQAKKPPEEQQFPLADLIVLPEDNFRLNDVLFKVTANADELRKYRDSAKSLTQLEDEAKRGTEQDRQAFALFKERLYKPAVKPAGRMRSLPWYEYRGENPYILVERTVKEMFPQETATAAKDALPVKDREPEPPSSARRSLLTTLVELVPVLLEPLVKILMPIFYLFHPEADWYVKLYLILALLWALAVWGFFGGAITRLAAVQVARNEKLTLREALLFTKDRFVSYFAAPAFPIALLAILTFSLFVFGWVEAFTYYFGDIVVAGLFWPVVLIVGLIMAVVLVGLVGWPLMNATISAEGSDSFDALSRSYSYVYQAPWHYLWYSFLSIIYGAAVVFFILFMASLLVFLGKWGVGQSPGISSSDPKYDREPTYLFIYAPTSYGWRDLLIHNSRFAVKEKTSTPTGVVVDTYKLTPAYTNTISWSNQIGAVLVSVWMYVFFLLVVGFAYSYFWTASTIIYFLMRRQVDDTDLDEVHLEEDELADPFMRPVSPAAANATPGKPDKVSLTIVEPPTLRTSVSATPPATAPPNLTLSAPPPPASPPLDAAPPPTDGSVSTAEPDKAKPDGSAPSGM